MRQYRQPKIKEVLINDKFFSPRRETNLKATIPYIAKRCKDTGRFDVWKWKEGMPMPPAEEWTLFWDSDVGKWIEAAAYSLIHNPDKKIEAQIDAIIGMMDKAQLPNGYLNSYFIIFHPKDAANGVVTLPGSHVPYCAGHLIEAAIAYYEATDKDLLLNIMRRYADLFAKSFGSEEGKHHAYGDHQEIELALVKLYRLTSEKSYLQLSKYLLDARGNHSDAEKKELQEHLTNMPYGSQNAEYILKAQQDHLPVRQQKSADGHAVRCLYMLAGMADVAAVSGDRSLFDACRQIWKSIAHKRMYITGGVGSIRKGEAFTFDYDLPNNEAYAETCASIALVFFADAMLNIDGGSEYADVMETAIYNGIMSGVALSGNKFFYENPLEAVPERDCFYKHAYGQSVRREWFGCACCPPNIARFLASLEKYIYSLSDDEIRLNLYVGNEADFKVAGVGAKIKIETEYPWDGKVAVHVSPEQAAEFAFSMRMPGWCEKAALLVNGKKSDWKKLVNNGYITIRRRWQKCDKIELDFDMPVNFVRANPNVRGNIGKVAVRRGPVVYCLEEADNGKNLASICLSLSSKPSITEMRIEGTSFPAIKLSALKIRQNYAESPLYSYAKPKYENFMATAVPYFMWANRNNDHAEMTVWLNKTGETQ